MSAVKHTPGPWEADTTSMSDVSTVWAVDDKGVEWPAPIADCGDYEARRPVAEAQANARLIAASPDLLKLAKLVRRNLGSGLTVTFLRSEIEAFDVVIASAEGRS